MLSLPGERFFGYRLLPNRKDAASFYNVRMIHYKNPALPPTFWGKYSHIPQWFITGGIAHYHTSGK
jgi:hypothetical protein